MRIGVGNTTSIRKIVREQTKQANKNYIPHRISTQTKSSGEKIALTPATKSVFYWIMVLYYYPLIKRDSKYYVKLLKKKVGRSKAKMLKKILQ